MERDAVVALLDRLHAVQTEFYGGAEHRWSTVGLYEIAGVRPRWGP
ncbi:MAG TPA: hypothetical protein VGI54_10605 [Solirubrobacteraceae bacterium]